MPMSVITLTITLEGIEATVTVAGVEAHAVEEAPTADFSIRDEGTIVLFRPLTPEARDWFFEAGLDGLPWAVSSEEWYATIYDTKTMFALDQRAAAHACEQLVAEGLTWTLEFKLPAGLTPEQEAARCVISRAPCGALARMCP